MFKILKIEQYLFANISYLNISQITLGPPVIWVLSLVQAIVISFLYQMIFDNPEIFLWTNSSGHKSVQGNLYLNATIAKDFGEDGLGQHCEGCQHNCNSLCKRDSRWKYCFFPFFIWKVWVRMTNMTETMTNWSGTNSLHFRPKKAAHSLLRLHRGGNRGWRRIWYRRRRRNIQLILRL